MKPKNLYQILVGATVYITKDVFRPLDGLVSENLPVTRDNSLSSGVWKTARTVRFTEDDRAGHAAGRQIELFRLPNAVNARLFVSEFIPLYLVVGRDEVIVMEEHAQFT